jgi:hypothetical protein
LRETKDEKDWLDLQQSSPILVDKALVGVLDIWLLELRFDARLRGKKMPLSPEDQSLGWIAVVGLEVASGVQSVLCNHTA